MTTAASGIVTSVRGSAPDLATTQRRAGQVVTRRATRRVERAALENLAAAATHHHIVVIATHANRPDLSHLLDTGQFEWLIGAAA
jgi:hypothetical protein